MSYKYQQDILRTLHEDVERRIEDKNYIRKGQQDLADMHRCDTERLASELNEVYAKAEAWDILKERLENSSDIPDKETILEAMKEIYKEVEEGDQ